MGDLMNNSEYIKSREKGFLENGPLISVVVPIYNMEKYLARCLDSIITQTYRNLEIILVNDASTDESSIVIEQYIKKDDRIKVVNHEKNSGLFQARISGIEVANGKYLAFVDSDDYISVDWFRLLLKKAEEGNFDMVIGNTVNEDEKGEKKYYNNYRSMNMSNNHLYGNDLIRKLLEQAGGCFAWHTVWNKLYSKKLIDKSMPFFKKVDRHLIMGEDIAYSIILYSNAKSMGFVDVDAYFYFRHSEASTSLKLPKPKLMKNVKDIGYVFEFAEACLKELNKDIIDELIPYLEKFKEKYFRIWSGNVLAAGYSNDKEICGELYKSFGKSKLIYPQKDEFYFYEIETHWSERYENCKKAILSDDVEYVSFDIFDTLIKRPLYSPSDIFFFVADTPLVKQYFSNDRLFIDMRNMADTYAREKLTSRLSSYEDVTLIEIYDALAEIYDISIEDAHEIRKIEEELEIKLCTCRDSVKEIYDLAIEAGKKVIIISDMYLEENVVNKILKKNGYDKHEKLYLSSTHRRLKATGSLFDFVIEDLKIKKVNSIIHIGDNYNSDVLIPQSYGFQTYFYPKIIETFENSISDIETQDIASVYIKNLDMFTANQEYKKALSIRCMLAVAANKLFDNPFQPYHYESSFNADSYKTGYYVLGMHVFALAKWIYDVSVEQGYETVLFLARDGKMLHKAFDLYKKTQKIDISSNYFYASRKALLPFLIEDKKDFYDIYQFIDIWKHSPKDILDMYKVVLSPLTKDIEKKYTEKGILLDKKFKSFENFNEFINVLMDVSFDRDLIIKNNKIVKALMEKEFTEKTATFDIGYSGRLQQILCKLAGKPIDVFFVHDDGVQAKKLATNFGFKIHNFYEFTPKITGIIREYFISDPAPACIGYDLTNHSSLIPIFEKDEKTYTQNYAIRKFQQGAVDYVSDIVSIFGEYFHMFDIRHIDASAAFEYFLLNSNWRDKQVYSASVIEDEVCSGYSDKSVFDTWMWQTSQIQRVHPILTENILPDLYADGYFVKLYHTMNKMFPKGGKMRNILKKIASIVLH